MCADTCTCANGCGRACALGSGGRRFKTCCRSCAHLGGRGHDIDCDIQHNGATCPPWYWGSAKHWPGDFHAEVAGKYVQKMAGDLIGHGLSGQEVVRVVRVEDSTLWKAYAAKRAALRTRGVTLSAATPQTSGNLGYSARTTMDASVGETYLFHGTSAEVAAKIAKENFIPSRAGTFGPGVYFADNAAKSNSYVKSLSDDGCKAVLLCRVSLGNLAPYGDSTAWYADTFTGVRPLGESFREFIVKDIAQIYPEYIVFYRDARK